MDSVNLPSPLATIPIARSERWALLRDVVEQWYSPVSSADGVSLGELDSAKLRLGVSLPAAIREWYALVGRRNDIWSRQDHLLQPEEFRINDDHLVFMIENQNVVEWGIHIDDLAIDDPPIYVTSVDEPNIWLKENDSVSEFALQMFAYCLKWLEKGRWWANAYVTPDVLDCISVHYPRLPFAEWHWPTSTRFYGLRDIIAEVEAESDDDHAWLYIVMRTAAAAHSFKHVVGSLNIE